MFGTAIALVAGMSNRHSQIPAEPTTAKTVIVIDEDAQRRRRIDFILRIAGYEVLGLQDDQEAANWLLSQPAMQVVALVVMPLKNSVHVGTLTKIIPARVSVPVIFVTASEPRDAGKYVDVVFEGGNRCLRTTEPFLLEALQNILKLKPALRGPSNDSTGEEENEELCNKQ